jgi:hypothetical protein
MLCWNCNHEMPEAAKVCQHCEAALADSPFPDDPAARQELEDFARDVLANMSPEDAAELRRAASRSQTADEFANSIFVGDCPKCGSSNTGDCENDPEIDCILAGRCYDCGQLWCTECERLLDPKAAVCPCWDEDDDEEE